MDVTCHCKTQSGTERPPICVFGNLGRLSGSSILSPIGRPNSAMRITWRWPSITVLRRCYWISRIMPKSRYFLQPGSMTGTRIPILTQKDIDREPTADANPRFGMTFHSLDWVTDYLAPMGSIGFGVRNLDVLPMSISERLHLSPARESTNEAEQSF